MRLIVAIAALSLLLPAAASASKAEVRVGFSRVVYAGVAYTASEGEANDVTLEGDEHTVVVTDPGADIEAGDGCTPSGDHSVTCTSEYELSVTLGLGDEVDHFTSEGPAAYVYGMQGNDVLDGGEAPVSLNGGTGDDVLEGWGNLLGGEGDDTMTGSDDRDFFMGGPGADSIDGRDNPHTYILGDKVSYVDHAGPVTIDLSSPVAPAGAPGEGDTISNVENAEGTNAADRITAPRVVTSGLTSWIEGRGGDDLIRGGPGPDDLNGDEGHDSVRGGGGDDRLYGGAGRDTLKGGGGFNRILSQEGSIGQRDWVDCGEDGTVTPSSGWEPGVDLIDQSCDRVEFPLVPIKTLRYRYDGQPTRAISTTFVCVRRCDVTITLRAQGKPMGSARRALRRGQRATLTIPLTEAAREELARTGRLKVRFSLASDWGRRLRNRAATSYPILLHDPPAAR